MNISCSIKKPDELIMPCKLQIFIWTTVYELDFCSWFECPHCKPTVVSKLPRQNLRRSNSNYANSIEPTRRFNLPSVCCIRLLRCFFIKSSIVFDYRTQSNPIAWIRPRLINRKLNLVRFFETVSFFISVNTEVKHLLPLELSLSAFAHSVLSGKGIPGPGSTFLWEIDFSISDKRALILVFCTFDITLVGFSQVKPPLFFFR